MTVTADIIDQAIGWHLRLADATEDDWADFVAWLEADPAHSSAYDTVALDDRLIDGGQFAPIADPIAANDNARPRWLWLAGGSVAAAIMVALLVPAALSPGTSSYDIETRPGERRVVALADGTRIELSGGTTLRLDRADARVAALKRGEAMFHVRHDAAHPFVLTAGDVTMRDLGTAFDVTHDGQQLSVAVSEGAVRFETARDGTTLKAGEALSARSDGSGIVRTRIAPGAVGGWRSNMLSFDGQRLGDVVATIGRLYGTRITLVDGLSDRPFTGMVRFEGTADRDVPHLADLIGAKWRREGEGWILSGGTGATR